jgi:hypothetical protein
VRNPVDKRKERLYPIGTIVSYTKSPEITGYVIGYKECWVRVRLFNELAGMDEALFTTKEMTILAVKT